MDVWTLISTLLSIIIIGLTIWMIITPAPLKLILNKIYFQDDYNANVNANVTPDYTLYSMPNSKHDKLIVIFVGGAFLFSIVSNVYGIMNVLNEKLTDKYDILTFSYPVRFKYTLKDSLIGINKILSQFVHYPVVHAVGVSAGVLLAGAFYQKESNLTVAQQMQVPQIGMQFKSFCGLSGIYETKLNTDLLTTLFDFYIMRNTPSKLKYTCYNMPIPKYVISAKSDFLLAQTVKYAQNEPCQYHIYDSLTLPHAFSQLINLPEALDSLDRISQFIVNVDANNNNNNNTSSK